MDQCLHFGTETQLNKVLRFRVRIAFASVILALFELWNLQNSCAHLFPVQPASSLAALALHGTHTVGHCPWLPFALPCTFAWWTFRWSPTVSVLRLCTQRYLQLSRLVLVMRLPPARP